MAHAAADALASIKQEIQEINAKIDQSENNLDDVHPPKERTELDQLSDLNLEWRKQLDKEYEAEARAKEQKASSTSSRWIIGLFAGFIIACLWFKSCDFELASTQ